jgi:modulator of FtsH protease
MPTYQDLGYGGAAIGRERARTVFGQVMGLVALTVGCTALGAYITRNTTGHSWIVFYIGAFVCIFGLNIASARGREQLATALLFGMGLLLGMATGPVLALYAKANHDVLYQAAGATGAFVAGLGSYGYATRRDLSYWARTLFWSLLALIGFGIIGLFIAIPHGNVIYAVAGLAIFGAFTIFDFNRLRRTTMAGAVPIAASIFLDIFNVFLFMLRLLGGGGRS